MEVQIKNRNTNKSETSDLIRLTKWGAKRHTYEVVVGKRNVTIKGPDRFGKPWILVLPNKKEIKMLNRYDILDYLKTQGV